MSERRKRRRRKSREAKPTLARDGSAPPARGADEPRSREIPVDGIAEGEGEGDERAEPRSSPEGSIATAQSRAVLAAAVALATALVFLNAAPDAFVFDDANFLPIPHAEGEGLTGALRKAFGGDLWPARRLNVDAYRPLTFLSLLFDGFLFGSRAWGFHVTSIVLHVGVTVLLFFVLSTLVERRGFGASSPRVAAVGASMFGVHPIHIEAIDCAFNRGDLLVALLTLAALAVLLRFPIRDARKAWGIAGGLYFIALFCKENAATLPVLAAAVLSIVEPPKSVAEASRRFRFLPWFLVPLGLFLVARHAAVGHATWSYGHVLSIGQSLALTATAFRDMLAMILWPWPLRAVRTDYSAEALPLAVIVLCAFAFAVYRTFRAMPGVSAGLSFFAVAALPTLPVVTNLANAQPMAERYAYVPSVGLAIALSFGLASLERRGGALPLISAAVVACVLGLLSRSRNEAWHSDVALFEAEVAAKPSNPEAVMDLGAAYSSVGRLDDTLSLCARHRTLGESGYERLFTACARILEVHGRFGEAEPYFESGAGGDAPPADYIVYGRFLARSGRSKEAEAQYDRAVELERDPVRRRTTRAEMLLKLHPERLSDALSEIDAAVSEDPAYEIAKNLRQRIVAAMGEGPADVGSAAPSSGAARTAAVSSRAEPGPPGGSGSVFGEAATGALLRGLREAPPGSPAWVAARADDAAAIERQDAMAEILTQAGWTVRKSERTTVPVRPGVFLYAADDDPPPYVQTVHRALVEAGLSPTYATGYRSYYDESVRTKPGYRGFSLAPDQSFILVFGRVK